MRSQARGLLLSALLVSLLHPAAVAQPRAPRPAAATPPAQALHKLFDEQWEWTMREFPTFAS
ncbi:MAG TPA: hypothetical protein VG148_14335, partial [Pyrinomonadaceae bacterium]|nr:hypothetical protein [Pyrinomonadaceae bacterium]